MSYYNKYLKYKNKYVSLKKQLGGNREYFETVSKEPGTILYHATFNKVIGKLYSPSYYSTDIMQSLGHLLSTSSKFDNKGGFVVNDLIKISSCYPFIYKFSNSDQINLLKMNVGAWSFDNTFGILLNKAIYKEYLDRQSNRIEIINNFKIKLMGIGEKLTHCRIDDATFEENYNKLFDKYIEKCKLSCWGGWANTPGYYLLSSIDYNSYLKQILPDIIPREMTLDGIYVDRDQDEIILLNMDKINPEPSIQYIIPYFLINKPIEDIRDFVNNYLRVTDEFLKNPTDVTKQTRLFELFKRFNYINEAGTHKWNFTWFTSFCKNYNPYNSRKTIERAECGVAPELPDLCLKRYPIDHSEIGQVEDYEQYMCDHERYSSKLSILEIEEYNEMLLEYIEDLKSDKVSDRSLGLFESSCTDRRAMLNRILS